MLCTSTNCLELALPNDIYCASHVAPLCQHIDPVFGSRCQQQALSRDLIFCVEHLGIHAKGLKECWNLSDTSDDDDSDEELTAIPKPTPCAGKNKKGKPCGSMAMPNSNYCHAHAPSTMTSKHAQIESRERKQLAAIERVPGAISSSVVVEPLTDPSQPQVVGEAQVSSLSSDSKNQVVPEEAQSPIDEVRCLLPHF